MLDYTKSGHAWYATKCDNPFHKGNFPFVCAVPPRMMSGNHTLILDKASLGFQILHFWWSHELESKSDTSQGIEISWSIKNGSTTDLEERGNNQTLGKRSPNPIMLQVLTLVKLSKMNKVDEAKVWSALLNQRWIVTKRVAILYESLQMSQSTISIICD